MKKLKVGDKVKTSKPDGTGVIYQTDVTSVPYCVEFDTTVRWDFASWDYYWFHQSSVTLINKIKNKLK